MQTPCSRNWGSTRQNCGNPGARYTYDLVCKAGIEASKILKNPHAGLRIGAHFTPLDFNALGVTFLSSFNLLEALQRLDRYETLLNSRLDFTVIEHDNHIELTATVEGLLPEALEHIENTRAAVVLELARLALGQDFHPRSIAFTYPEPADTNDHTELAHCPLIFSAHISSITFELADAHRPFTAANRELALCNDRFLDEMLEELKEEDLISTVKRTIIAELPSGAPCEAGVAERVFMSSRTLQRKLAEEGTSFRTLVADIRQDLALRYITDVKMPLSEISYMLGFADTSSFSPRLQALDRSFTRSLPRQTRCIIPTLA